MQRIRVASDHTQTHSYSVRQPGTKVRHDLHLTTHNTHNIHASIPLAVFEPAIPIKQPTQTHALDRSTTAIAPPSAKKIKNFNIFNYYCRKKTPPWGTGVLSSEFRTQFTISSVIAVSCTLSAARPGVGVSVRRRCIHSSYWFAINQDSVCQEPVSSWLLYYNLVYWSITTSPQLPGSFSFGFSFTQLWRFSVFLFSFNRERSSLFILRSEVLVRFFGRRRHCLNIHPSASYLIPAVSCFIDSLFLSTEHVG